MPKMDAPAVVEPDGIKAVASKAGRKHRPEDREIKYPDFQVRMCWAGPGGTEPPLSLDAVKKALGLETESEYVARVLSENPKLKESEVQFPNYVLVLRGPDKQRFVCWNNRRNRRLQEGECTKLAYEFLDGRWAGPCNYPGETVNGAPVRITRQGWVFDGQYRLIAYYFAMLLRGMYSRYSDKWPEPPPFETVLITGVSDRKEIFDTTDAGVPRTRADNIYTSETFMDLSESDRWEISKMQMAAEEWLWKRTGAAAMSNAASFRSLATVEDFQRGHKTLEKCIRWLFDCNRERGISDAGVAAGHCAAAMYLMGSGDSDGDEYRKGDKSGNRREKNLLWGRMEKAKMFFEAIATGGLKTVSEALHPQHPETKEPIDLKASERFAILALAWHIWFESGKVNEGDLDLSPFMKPDSAGRPVLVDPPTFGNLDLGPAPDTETPEDVEAGARKEREEKARQAAVKQEADKAATAAAIASPGNGATVAGGKKGKGKKPAAAATQPPGKPEWEQLEDVRKEWPGKVIVFKGAATVYLYNGDADKVIQAHGQKPIRDVSNNGLRVASWPLDHCSEIVSELKSKGVGVAVASKDARGGTIVEER